MRFQLDFPFFFVITHKSQKNKNEIIQAFNENVHEDVREVYRRRQVIYIKGPCGANTKHVVSGTERVIARKICGGIIGNPKHRKLVIVLVIMCSQRVFARDVI